MRLHVLGYACRIDGRIDGDFYVKIIKEDLMASIEYYGQSPEDVIFQQDNDPKHTVASKTAPMFACSSKIQILCFNEWINF